MGCIRLRRSWTFGDLEGGGFAAEPVACPVAVGRLVMVVVKKGGIEKGTYRSP